MTELEWEGTYGYGDVIGALTNAKWQQHIMGEPVKLIVNWYTDRAYYPPTQKYHPDDPETVMERFEYIAERIGTDGIIIEHRDVVYTGEERDRPKWKNRWNIREWYATTWEFDLPVTDEGYICIWDGQTNKDNIRQNFSTRWKDPLGEVGWHELYVQLDRVGMPYKRVSYRQPIDEVFRTIAGSSWCIGYEGMGQMIAKCMFKPMVTFTDLKDHGAINTSRNSSGEWARLTNHLEGWVLDPEPLYQYQSANIVVFKNRFHALQDMLEGSGELEGLSDK